MPYNMYLSATLMAATCCSMIICYLCWKRRELPIAISYGLSMLTGAFYSFGYAFEVVSTSYEAARFWLHFQYIGIPFGTIPWFIMVLHYTGRQSLLNRKLVTALFIVPTITLIAHHTNQWHHLFYKTTRLGEKGGFPQLILEPGPLYYLHVAYSYSFFVIGMIFMVQMLLRATPRMKKQIALMIMGSWGPFGFTLIYLSDIFSIPFDISPFGFIVSGIFFIWGIYQFNMLKLAPLAMQKVFASMQDAVMIFDLDDTLTSFNESASRVIPGIQHDGVGQSAAKLFAAYPILVEKMSQSAKLDSRVQLTGPEDECFFNIYLSIIQDNRGRPAGKLLLLTDVTEMVRHEERLRHNARQLEELNTFKDKMFSIVAHDIRDPLAVSLNLMELMEDELQECGGKHDEVVHEMGQQLQKTFALVESLLEWFHNQRGGMVFNPVVRDLAQTIQVTTKLLQVRSESKYIRIVSDIPQDTLVYADKEMLDLIVRNLLSNAIKYTELGGIIRVQAEPSGEEVIVSVSDTGMGVSDEHIHLILQENGFPIPSVGTAGERGAGLGLSLCREFVHLNGGKIWFNTIHEQGTTFYFTLPRPSQEKTVIDPSLDRRKTG